MRARATIGSMTTPNAFRQFSRINLSRAARWHRGGLDEWSVTDWSNAFAGEAGELCNAVKKFRRVEDALQGHDGDTPQPKSREQAVRAIAKEIGDVYAYLDLTAQRFGLDTFECIRDTFNQISEREGMPQRIPVDFEDGRMKTINEAARVIDADRNFRVHSNDVTEGALKTILRLT